MLHKSWTREEHHARIHELFNKAVLTYKSTDPLFDESQKDETINRDIESIYSICKLRKGHIAYTLKDASHIFITTNNSLARISGNVQSEDNAPFSVPPCITDLLIGTLIWLQQPTKMLNLNRKRLIADAYAAIQPDRALIKRYLTEVDALKRKGEISNDEYYLLRSNRVSFNLLSEKTKNDSHNFESRTTREIMDELNKNHMAELRDELDKERKLKSEKTVELENQKGQLKEGEKKIRILGGRHRKLIRILATILTWVIICFIVPVLLTVLVITTFQYYFENLALQLVAFVCLAILSFSGFSIPGLKKWLFHKIEELIAKWSNSQDPTTIEGATSE